MTLNKHLIQGLPAFSTTVLDSSAFETTMTSAGYSKSGSAPAQGNRVKVWWIHSSYPRVESIYSPDQKLVITAYHVV
ncbi:MAG TPA: hypothetical protein DEF48_18095 [Nostoc sp. UBA8866]|nr:hypothetical protein [Nostoc sp. UBA8866]